MTHAKKADEEKVDDTKKDVSKDESKPKCKPCCACPETRKARDACIAEKGEESCKYLIEAHRKCMLDLGFKI